MWNGSTQYEEIVKQTLKQKFREIAQLGKMRKTNLYIPLTEDTPPSPFEVRPP